MPTYLANIIGMLLRRGFFAIGVVLVDRGMVQQNDWETLTVAAIPVLASLIWSLWNKYRAAWGKQTLL